MRGGLSLSKGCAVSRRTARILVVSVGRTWTEVSLYPLYLTGASNGQQTIRTSFDGKIITLPFSENTRRRPRSEKILQSTEDQNYKRGILFPIFYFEKIEREISPSTALSEFPQRAQPTQYNTTSKISSPHSAVVIKGDTGNSYPLPNWQIKHSGSSHC